MVERTYIITKDSADRINAKLLEKEWSIRELAKQIEMDVSFLAKRLRREEPMPERVMIRISKALGVDSLVLFPHRDVSTQVR